MSQTLDKKRKFRKRPRPDEDDDTVDHDADDEVEVRQKLVLLRDAQKMKLAERRASLAPGPRASSAASPAKAEEDNTLGLKTSFKMEAANEEVERQMEQYIEDRMPGKMQPEPSEDQQAPKNSIFAIPDHLKVQARPAYDPGEGLPDAGLEEVELGTDVERKNIRETEAAKKMLMEDKKRIAREIAQAQQKREREQVATSQIKMLVSGNVSSNYQQHQNTFIKNLNADGSSDRRSKVAPGVATDNLVVKRFKDRFVRK